MLRPNVSSHRTKTRADKLWLGASEEFATARDAVAVAKEVFSSNADESISNGKTSPAEPCAISGESFGGGASATNASAAPATRRTNFTDSMFDSDVHDSTVG